MTILIDLHIHIEGFITTRHLLNENGMINSSHPLVGGGTTSCNQCILLFCRSDSDPHVRDCIKCYTADYTVVSRNYTSYSSDPCDRESSPVPKIAQRQEYEIDVDEPPSESDRVRWKIFLKSLRSFVAV